MIIKTREQSWKLRLARWLGRLLVDFWEAVAIFLLLLVAMGAVAGGSPLLVVVALLGLALLVAVSAKQLDTASAHVLGRRGRNSFRRDWPSMCDLLGWSEKLAVHAVGNDPDAKPAKVPDLIDYQHSATGLTVTIKPLASQDRKKWPAMADALARELGYPYQRWYEPRAGHLKIELIASELPSFVAYDPQVHASYDWDVVSLAVDPAGKPINWKPSEVPHLLIAGSTNGGKGSLLTTIMLHGLRTGWWIMAANPKGSGEFGWSKRLGVPVARDIDEINTMTDWLTEEMRRRQVVVEAGDVSNWTELPVGERWPPIMVVFDEVTSAMTINKANKKMASTQMSIGNDMAVFSMQARSVGIHLVAVAQRPDVNNLGPAGGLFRSNVDGRIAVCNLDADGLRMMFGNTDDPDIPRHLDGTKGRALFARLDAGGFDVYPGQIPYQSSSELKDNLPRPLVPQLYSRHRVGDQVSA